MSHFAQIDENNVVQQVLVIDQSEIDTGNWGDPATWIQTSYNTRGGVYYTPNTNTPGPDQSKVFRKNYAGIGYTWDGVGFAPPQPFPSWIKDSSTYQWDAPVAYPTDDKLYRWDEESLSWVEVTLPTDS
jgi:hypothetical protein